MSGFFFFRTIFWRRDCRMGSSRLLQKPPLFLVLRINFLLFWYHYDNPLAVLINSVILKVRNGFSEVATKPLQDQQLRGISWRGRKCFLDLGKSCCIINLLYNNAAIAKYKSANRWTVVYNRLLACFLLNAPKNFPRLSRLVLDSFFKIKYCGDLVSLLSHRFQQRHCSVMNVETALISFPCSEVPDAHFPNF